MERGISAVVLAGGFATRMGRDKAALELRGVSFAQHQVNKLRALGIDVMPNWEDDLVAFARRVAPRWIEELRS